MPGHQVCRLQIYPERLLSWGVLAPGMQAAIDLLTREADTERVAGDIAEGKDLIAEAMEHAHHFQAYHTAIELLTEQMERLKKPVG